MKQRSKLIFVLSVLLLSIFLILGLALAHHKSLWRDEINTQTYTVHEPYIDILSGKNTNEGNRAPLFYVQQKAFCDIFHFHTPEPWLNGHWEYIDHPANIFLRILPVFWMSSFFLLLFIYFSFRFNIFFGILGLCIAFTSPLLWLYWAEARPYGLWVLLTALQMILYLEMLQDKRSIPKKWLGLSLVHILLSLTCVLSFFQIAIVCIMLIFKERRWQRYILPFAIPLFFIYIYKPHGAFDDVIFVITVAQMVFSAIPPNQLCILLFYPLLLRIYSLQDQKLFPPLFTGEEIPQAFPFFLSIFLMVFSIFLFLTFLHAHATGKGQFVVSRHIVFLVPVSVIGITYLTGLIGQSLRSSFWLKISIFVVIAGLLLYRIDTVWAKIYYLFTNNLYS